MKMPLLSITIASVALALGLYVLHELPAPPTPTTVQCDSGDALAGAGFTVNLDRPVEPQGCHYDTRFDGRLLCDREVTIACELP